MHRVDLPDHREVAGRGVGTLGAAERLVRLAVAGRGVEGPGDDPVVDDEDELPVGVDSVVRPTVVRGVGRVPASRAPRVTGPTSPSRVRPAAFCSAQTAL